MSNPPPRAALPPAHQIAGRALHIAMRRRCPACGKGHIWSSWLSLRPACPVCGLAPGRGEHDTFIGGVFINFVVAEIIVVLGFISAMILTWPDPPWRVLTWGTAALAVVAPIVTYPFTLTFWLAVDMTFRPPGYER